MFDRIILLIYNLIGGWVRDKLLDLSDKEDIDLGSKYLQNILQ